MYLEIISPEKTLFKGEVESVLFPGTYGDFQVLNNHAPIVSTLTKGKVKILGNISIDKDVKYKFKNKIIRRLTQKGWEMDLIIKCLNRLIK